MQKNRTMDLIRKIYRSSLLVLIPVSVLSAFIEWKKLPASIIIGGILGLLNIKGLAWGVEGLLGTYKANAKMIIFSSFRLLALCIIIAVLVYLKLVNIFGILVGFTIIFTMLVIEGLKYAKADTK